MSSPRPSSALQSHAAHSRLARLALFVAGASLFALTAMALHWPHLPMIDLGIMESMHAVDSAALDMGMLAITNLGSALALVPLEMAFLWWLVSSKKMSVAAFMVSAVGGAAVLNAVLKNIFARPRPEVMDALAVETSASFPSGHAMHTMALLLAMAIVCRHLERYPQKLACLFIFVLLVGCSKVYVGVHYPSDVLAAWAAALAWVALCSLPFRWDRLVL